MSTRELDVALVLGTDDAFCGAVSEHCQFSTSQHPTSDRVCQLGIENRVFNSQLTDLSL